jgi:putative DNA primase/helicase
MATMIRNPLLKAGCIYEVRIPGTTEGTISGFFDNGHDLYTNALEWEGRAKGIYFTMNPVRQELFQQAPNRLLKKVATTTKDADIVRRLQLLVDCDPLRPSGVSATESEHQAALERIRKIRAFLRSQGWPEPTEGDSGNGGHLLYEIDLPNDAESTALVKAVLNMLAGMFDDELVKVDTSVYNAARITKLYGTLTCKGPNTDERPHRRSAILSQPLELLPVSRELLEALAATRSEKTSYQRRTGGSGIDLPAFIARHKLEVVREKQFDETGELFELRTCPFNPAHERTASVMQFSNGAVDFNCFHNSCAEYDWAALKALLEPTLPCTDVGNALRFARQHRGAVRWCPHWKCWLVYDGKRWVKDTKGRVMQLAKQTARAIVDEAQGLDDDDRRRMLAWALASENVTRLKAMVELAKSEDGIAVAPEELDCDPWLLNVENGTLDLRTAELLPHDRTQLLTKLVPIRYETAATCPTWLAFLVRIMANDEELIAFLQRAFGYSLTASVRDRVLFLLHGAGANGKSTLTRILLALLGDYGLQTPSETLLASRHDGGIRNDLARFAGARVVAAMESDGGRKLAAALIKQLTGGDVLTARFLFSEFFDMTPSWKIWFSTNHRPFVTDDGDAMWDRMRLIPFDVRIPEAEQDKQLLPKLMLELPGILVWSVEGCRRWQQEGLGLPAKVSAANSEYRESERTFDHFLTEKCNKEAGARVSFADLRKEYVEWTQVNSDRTMSVKAMGAALQERGFKAVFDKGRFYEGLTLKF